MEYQFEAIGPALSVLVLIFMIVFALLLLGLALFLAGLPGRLATARQHPQAEAINICGWLGLPTGILWVLAMVWALYRQPAGRPPQTLSSQTLSQQLDALEAAISQLESQQQKATS